MLDKETHMVDIELYDWQEGRPRPGTQTKHRQSCIDILEVPRDALPQVGDIVFLTNTASHREGRYRVLSREFFWTRSSDQDSQDPAKFNKMWLHVRELTDEEYEAEPKS